MNLPLSGRPVSYLYVTDRERALGFYCKALGFELRSSDQFGDFIDLGSALLRMTVMPDHHAHPHPVLGWDVEDIGTAVESLTNQGVTFIIYEGMGQDSLGIWTSPDGKAKVAFFADPDRNVLSFSQSKPM